MRKLHKYKIYNLVSPVSKFPLRLLKFKRPKWHKLQQRIIRLQSKKLVGQQKNRKPAKKQKKKAFGLIDVTVIKRNLKFWSKTQKNYKENLRTYSFLQASFDSSSKIKKLKSYSDIKIRKDKYLKYFFQNYYQVCTLLWLTHFFGSSFAVKQKINSKSVFVNGQLASANAILNCGDVIHVDDLNIDVKSIRGKYNKTFSLLTNVEIDYYSQNLVLVKGLSDLSNEDFYFLSLDYINIQNLR